MSRLLKANCKLFSSPLLSAAGRMIYAASQRLQTKEQSLATFFFRNIKQVRCFESELSFLARSEKLDILVAGCSLGCEVYTLAGYLAVMFPDVHWKITALDISSNAVAHTAAGVYSSEHGLGHSSDPLINQIEERLFTRVGQTWRIQDNIKEHITVVLGDVLAENFSTRFQNFDVVLGQNFLIHMQDEMASKAFFSLLQAVRPGGALFVAGMNLDLRTRLSRQSGLTPVECGCQDIHNCDPVRRGWWPWKYWSLEPFDQKRANFYYRYGTIFIK